MSAAVEQPPSCAACGKPSLARRWRLGGDAGPQGLIPNTDRFGTALADIWRCRSCGHMQVHPMPVEESLVAAYAEAASDAYIEQEAGQRVTARRALAQIERHASCVGELLDLGCWVGFLLAEARDRGWRATGVEPSEFGSTYARDRLGLEVVRGDLLAVDLPTDRYDAVTMGDVIEHLTDPSAALRRIRELLSADGVLWLALPDAGSLIARLLGRRWWSVIPTHTQYFTRRSIVALLARGGFEVLELTSAPKAFTVSYYLGRLSGYAPALARGLIGASEHVGLAGRMWAPDLHDRMAVIARAR